MSARLVVYPEPSQPGDLLLREIPQADSVPAGWTRFKRSVVCFRRADGQELVGKETIAVRGGVLDEDESMVPMPDESPIHGMDPDEPCNTCEPLRLWWRAWWADS